MDFSVEGDARADFVGALSEANCGHGTWEPGWRIRPSEEAVRVAEKGGLRLWVKSEEYRARASDSVSSEDRFELRLPKEMTGVSPGFYMALGNSPLGDSAAELIRIYWNATPAGAICLMREATATLNGAGIPFKIKSLHNPDAFHRCDSVVLYLRKGDFGNVEPLARRIHRCVAPSLKPGIPALTKLLAPGVGFAEGPPDGSSFGMSRCAMIAEGLIGAQWERQGDREGVLEGIVREFQSRGVALEEPFLNAGSQDSYQWTLGSKHAVADSAQREAHEARHEPSFQDVALAIGRRLCSQAIWDGGRCNWIGPLPDVGNHGVGNREKSGALGPDIYSGTSGVALFLAELHGRVDDPNIRKTALGAMRQAVLHVDSVTPRTNVGFYCGWTGIALSAAWVGLILREDSLIDAAGKLIRRFGATRNGNPPFDVISGCAGAIPALLALGTCFDEEACADLAVQMGNRLLRTAQRSRHGLSWKILSERRNLTGLSHGAAGAGMALAELFQATGQHLYRDAAMEAFRYERSWYSPEEGNWRDLRSGGGHLRRSTEESFAMTWCHGAPGIALSRLRAFEITGEDLLRREAEGALQATRRSVDLEVARGGGNDSLCHGAMGNADVLLCGDEMLRSLSLGREPSLRIGEMISREWSTDAGAEPAGSQVPRPPGLMLGAAGAGYFLLRVTDPTVPSALLLQRDSLLTSRRDRTSQPTKHRFES